MSDTRSAAWDTYAQTKPPRRQTNAKGDRTWFNWTQYADHGPGVEVLALPPGGRVLDLGCGSGGNAAHLATLGMEVVGVDLSGAQLTKARERWSGISGMDLQQEDAQAYLADRPLLFDAIYSVFGAVWFTDPECLMPVVYSRLKPGGIFAFSQRPPVEGCYGCQASYIPRGTGDEDPAIVKRWDHAPETWAVVLGRHGFESVSVTLKPAPSHAARRVGTLVGRGVRPGSP